MRLPSTIEAEGKPLTGQQRQRGISCRGIASCVCHCSFIWLPPSLGRAHILRTLVLAAILSLRGACILIWQPCKAQGIELLTRTNHLQGQCCKSCLPRALINLNLIYLIIYDLWPDCCAPHNSHHGQHMRLSCLNLNTELLVCPWIKGD